MAHRFHHSHIKSRDPRKTARWWADMFGAKILPERERGGALFAPVDLGGITIMISSPRPDEEDKIGEGDANVHYGLEHVGLVTDDIDADLARLREQGLEIFDVMETDQFKIAFVETPEKVRVELLQAL